MRMPLPHQVEPEVFRTYQHDLLEAGIPRLTTPYIEYQQRIRFIVRFLTKKHPTGAKVLDIGSAQGNISLLLSEKGRHFSCICYDLKEAFLRYSHLKYEKGIVYWVCGDAMSLPFKKNSFDVVILGEILEHLNEPLEILNQARLMLNARGMIVITTPNGGCWTSRLPTYSSHMSQFKNELGKKFVPKPDADGHLFLFVENELRDILKKMGFKIRYQSKLNGGIQRKLIGMLRCLIGEKQSYFTVTIILMVIGFLDRIYRIIPFLKDSSNTLIFVITESNVK